MPAQLKYGFLCDGAVPINGKWNFLGLFEVFRAVEFPAQFGEFVLALKFAAAPGPHILRIQFLNSVGNLIAPELRRTFEAIEFSDSTVTITIAGMIFPAAGFYCARVGMDQEDKPFAVIDFQVQKLQLGKPTPPQPV